LFQESSEESFRENDIIQDIVIEPGDREHNSLLSLLHFSKNVNGQNGYGTTALHVACKRGSTEMVKKLLYLRKKSIAVNKTDNHNNTPLLIACAHGNREMCKALIEAGACFKRKNKNEMNPLHVAALAHNEKVINVLLTHEKCIQHKKYLLEDRDKHGNTPFLLAVQSGDVRVVRHLIDYHVEDDEYVYNSYKLQWC